MKREEPCPDNVSATTQAWQALEEESWGPELPSPENGEEPQMDTVLVGLGVLFCFCFLLYLTRIRVI